MIRYENVTKIFGSGAKAVTAVNNVTMQVEAGDLVTLLGPSGCGKTTLLRLTNRLIPLTSGRITVDGRDILSEDPVKLRQSMGYAIQAVGLFPNKTIYENIATVPRLLKWKEDRIRSRVDELLTMLRLDPEAVGRRYPVELSGGQQQRVGVARCLAADPKLLLMDEPFGAIDPINREVIQNEFLRIQARLRKTIIFVTHDIHEAVKMGDKIAIFQAGRLVQYDTPEAVLTRPKNDYIADFVGADRALKVLGLLRVRDALGKAGHSSVHSHRETPKAGSGPEVEGGGPDAARKEAKSRVETAEMGDTLKDVLSSMLMSDVRELSVVNDRGEPVGSITMDDVRRAIREMYAEAEPD